MKTTIILAIAALLTVTAFCQKKQKLPLNVLNIDSMGAMGVHHDTSGNTRLHNSGDTVFIIKAKFVKIGDRVFSMEQLTQTIPLFVNMDWIISQFTYLRTSKNGEFTDVQLDQLKAPLLPYVQAYQQVQQRAQKPGN